MGVGHNQNTDTGLRVEQHVCNSWFLYVGSHASPIPEDSRERVVLRFIVSKGEAAVEAEQVGRYREWCGVMASSGLAVGCPLRAAPPNISFTRG